MRGEPHLSLVWNPVEVVVVALLGALRRLSGRERERERERERGYIPLELAKWTRERSCNYCGAAKEKTAPPKKCGHSLKMAIYSMVLVYFDLSLSPRPQYNNEPAERYATHRPLADISRCKSIKKQCICECERAKEGLSALSSMHNRKHF